MELNWIISASDIMIRWEFNRIQTDISIEFEINFLLRQLVNWTRAPMYFWNFSGIEGQFNMHLKQIENNRIDCLLLNEWIIIGIINKHFESSQKLLKSSFVNERFKKYSMLPNELLTFEATNFKNLKYYWKLYCVHLCCKLVTVNWFCVQLFCKQVLCTADL